MSDNKCLKKVNYRDCYKESYDELTELEAQFRNVYTLKALEAQIAEKKADDIAQQTRENFFVKLTTQNQQKIHEEELKSKSIQEYKKRQEYKLNLEEQIESKIMKKLDQQESDKKEREILIQVDKIIDEEYEMTKKYNRQFIADRLRREYLIFIEIREIKRTMMAEMEVAAAKKEQKYHDEIEKRTMEMKKLQNDQRKKREILIENVAKLFVDGEREKYKRESVITDLIAEEMKYQLLIKEDEREYKIKQDKSKLAEDLIQQMICTVESEAHCRERDRIFIENVMEKIMEDQRVAILTAEAKRRKQLDYKKDLIKLMEDRKKIRETAVAEFKEELRAERLKEEIRKQEIKDERQRLIKEHAENVAKYLKKGVFSKKEEEEYLLKKMANN